MRPKADAPDSPTARQPTRPKAGARAIVQCEKIFFGEGLELKAACVKWSWARGFRGVPFRLKRGARGGKNPTKTE